ncbi:MAG: 3-hydroxybutyryl-CoA dehydrogenase [Deltaproteobacteria bacterium]|nr:3-hydroxybutyryl-CoA dehydrogenase [Deltaproteobacteria bacterium]
MLNIKIVGVVGAGQMGRGIAQVAAASGFDVRLFDAVDGAAARGRQTIADGLAKLVSKGKLTEAQASETIARLHVAQTLDAFADVDVAIEAATENFGIKQAIFANLDRVCPPHALLASNTSSISITSLSAATQRPSQVIGMHFMNPVPLMKLVEVIRGLPTSEETYAAVIALAASLEKTTVTSRDIPGFIVNRILMPMVNEACFALYEGIATAEDIDRGCVLGLNHPMGPLALVDLIGLDTTLFILEVLHRELGDDKYRPCPLLRQYVAAGWLGRKTGRGFFTYA